MIYIPIKSDAAEKLSRAIYQLSRPNSVRDPADVSTHYCEWIQHPTQASLALVAIPDTGDIPVHLQAKATLLTETLTAMEGKEITKEEAEAIKSEAAKKGSRLQAVALVPASWPRLTREQAKEQGYIVDKAIVEARK